MRFTSDVSSISLVQRKLEESLTRPVTSYIGLQLNVYIPFQILLSSTKEVFAYLCLLGKGLSQGFVVQYCSRILSDGKTGRAVFYVTFKKPNKIWIYILLTLPCPLKSPLSSLPMIGSAVSCLALSRIGGATL